MMSVLMKRSSTVIIPPVGPLDGREDHWREAWRGPEGKGCH